MLYVLKFTSCLFLNRILLAPFGANKASTTATVSPVVVVTNEADKNKDAIKDRGRDNSAFEMERQQEPKGRSNIDDDDVIICNEITETTALW